MSLLLTKRLQLAPITHQDAGEFHQLLSHPRVRKYLCDDHVLLLSQVEQMVSQSIAALNDNQYGLWVSRFVGEAAIVGFCGYWTFFEPSQIQLMYGVSPMYWAQGLAVEMGQKMLDYGFQVHGFETIWASADVPNQASIYVMQRLGMKFAKQEIVEGQELIFYQLGREDWRKQNGDNTHSL